ncbi:glycosyltransferase [Olivibacter sp. 47]|uniref:glycosyltransferase n=1 Tax=Olivibacter sp. 47 TaxID=3056486 RepID=UPI0025A33563|nr:glycosyltransferase [Olivibacter sp. 47]MDM8173470.1 glycosyltransferase [Olivibacter sp. 47]
MHDVWNNIDLDIVVVGIETLDEWKVYMVRNSLLFGRNGLRIVYALPEEIVSSELSKCVSQFPFLNLCIVSYSKSFSSGAILNTCLDLCRKDHICILDQQFSLQFSFFVQLKGVMIEYTKYYFSIINSSEEPSKAIGFAFPREIIDLTGGFDESLDQFYVENIKARLDILGFKEIGIDFSGKPIPYLYRNGINIKSSGYERALFPKNAKTHVTATNGKVIYDWDVWDKGKFSLLVSYLDEFVEYKIFDTEFFAKEYKIIALVQTYNEQKYIKDTLSNLSKSVDGIICLDDSSEDSTYELMNSEKLLFKVKKRRKGFDDLKNRNILLRLGSFLKSTYFFFIDADEMFEDRYNNVLEITERSEVDVWGIYLLNLWNNDYEYRADIPDGNVNSAHGAIFRWRIFKNIGPMQIYADKNLHFTAVPYLQRVSRSNLLLLHHGIKNLFDRKAKYDFYKESDENFEVHLKEGMYQYLLDDTVIRRSVKSFGLKHGFPYVLNQADSI